jgi:hypothetical protein
MKYRILGVVYNKSDTIIGQITLFFAPANKTGVGGFHADC